jgi:hypothetical protein
MSSSLFEWTGTAARRIAGGRNRVHLLCGASFEFAAGSGLLEADAAGGKFASDVDFAIQVPSTLHLRPCLPCESSCLLKKKCGGDDTMFERYTEKARRVIFFARYEASQYGSRYIESEHLLLGLLREDRALAKWFPGEKNVEPDIRAEIERRIIRGKRISTSVEVPLTVECKKILNLAGETSERLGHRTVETEHLLIGILRVEGSLAAQILIARGLKPGLIQEQLAIEPIPKYQSKVTISASLTLDSFLAGLKWLNSEELISYFAKNAEFIDAQGKRWNREEIYRGFETLFAPYAKKNASYFVESTRAETSDLFVATVLWKNALLASEQRAWMHRMSFVLAPEAENWEILLAQVTPVQSF